MKHSVKEWFAVTRYWSFAVSASPVIVTVAYLCSKGLVPFGVDASVSAVPAFPLWIVNAVLALLGAVILHAAGNVLSDWSDYRSGVDNPDAFAVPNLVFHKFEPREYLIFSIILFVVGIADGLLLTSLTGTGLLVIGGAGVLLTALYSFLKYRALGDLDIFLIFSVLIILGTGYVCTGTVLWEALVLAVPVGVITVSVLHANNTVDIVSDGAAGIKTFAMLIGARASSILYMVYMVLPFAWVILSVILGWLHPFTLLCLCASPIAWKNLRQASSFDKNGLEAMHGLDQASAKLQTAFSGLLAVGLFVSALI